MCVYAQTHYLFDLVFKVSVIFVVDHLGQTNLFCCGLENKETLLRTTRDLEMCRYARQKYSL